MCTYSYIYPVIGTEILRGIDECQQLTINGQYTLHLVINQYFNNQEIVMAITGKAMSPRGDIECSCCHLLAEFVFVGKDSDGDAYNTFSCANPMCFEDAEAMAEAGVTYLGEHIPNLVMGGGQ